MTGTDAKSGAPLATLAALMRSLFLFAPLWGYLSDRLGRRTILLAGLVGFGATTISFSFIQNLTVIYAERFLSGMFAAAVTPVALAAVGAGSFAVPLLWTTGLAVTAAAAIFLSVPIATPFASDSPAYASPHATTPWLIPKLLFIAFLVSASVSVFEVGLVLVPGAYSSTLTLVVIAAVASSAGILSSIITYWISKKAGKAKGAQLGRRSAAASLGAAVAPLLAAYCSSFFPCQARHSFSSLPYRAGASGSFSSCSPRLAAVA
ncbi:MFS transporter [Asticcacaulis sp. AC460]|uniref:MFS transporter n=1 Tax=Asticcacaulis sp. AC460 TaxID=1282360 RepID=UPI00040477E6|nr:MFS transporter [Asticcacaulis sp. AC460]